MKRKTILLLAVAINFITTAQQTQKIYQGKTYHKINNEWHFLEPNTSEYFKVEKNVITVKFNSNVTENLINSFISKNNLVFLRKL